MEMQFLRRAFSNGGQPSDSSAADITQLQARREQTARFNEVASQVTASIEQRYTASRENMQNLRGTNAQ